MVLKSAIISQTILFQGVDSDILICEPKQWTSGTKVTLTLKIKDQIHSANTPKSRYLISYQSQGIILSCTAT